MMTSTFHAFVRTAGAMTLLASCLLMPSSAHAADKKPLSSLPLMPEKKDADAPLDLAKAPPIPGIAVKDVKNYGSIGTHVEVNAATTKGYCFVDREYGLRLSSASMSSPFNDELWRFTETDGKAQLERTRIQVVPSEKAAWLRSRTTVELAPVTSAHGVTVWGFREGGDIVLVAKGADGGRESPHPKKDETADGIDMVSFVSSDCGWGATRLNTQLSKAGTLAQLRGNLPPIGEGKQKVTPHFVINGSISKVSRDPEPILAVNVQLTNDS